MNIFNKKEQSEFRSITVGGLFESLFNTNKRNVFAIGIAYACIRLISNTVSQTNIQLFRTKEGVKERVLKHPIIKLLNKPMQNTTPFMWLSLLTTQLTSYGNAYFYIIRKNGAFPTELLFIPDDNVSIYVTTDLENPFYYTITLKDGTQKKVFPDDMLHFKNISLDGVQGMSPIALHRLTFDIAETGKEFQKTYLDNASNISGVIETEQNLKSETVTQMRDNFGTIYGGSKNAGKTAILGGGAKYTQIMPISPTDADYINGAKLNKEDIMQIFAVPPPLLGDVSATYANSEQLSLTYQEFTISPIYTNIEQEINLKLLHDETLGFEFVPDLSKMATSRDRAETQAILKREGIYSANELRSANGHTNIKGGDEITLPLNTAPISLHKEVLSASESSDESEPIIEETEND